MARGRSGAPPTGWSIQSVVVRARDGPQRLDRVYRRLLTGSGVTAPGSPVGEEEHRNGSGNLRASLDRTPGAAAND
jgi:hypothetical protein